MKKNIFLLTAFALLSVPLNANHIAGGEFSVRHVEGNNFLVKLVLYRDCEGNFNLDNPITITVFDAVTNEILPNLTFFIFDPIASIIPLGNSCYQPDLCIEIQTYTGTISLPDNPNGYYMTWERCCRNEISVNIDAIFNGMVFTVSIADPALQNSTPEFLSYPAEAFFCINGGNSLDMSAFDVDGDSLVYSFTDPLRGDASSMGFPNPPTSGPRPYSTVAWLPGYSVDDQVGGNLPMSIDPQTGLIITQPNVAGFFTICILVEEYRDGVKLGEIRREIQLASLICNLDLPSVILTPDNDTIFDIYPGLNYCFELTITDPNIGDTLFVQAEGGIIDGTQSPLASFPDANGFSTIIQSLCWAPTCANVVDEPFVVTITAFSRGCANEVLITTQDIYFNVILEENLPTVLAAPTTGPLPGPGATIDLYDPSTHCFEFVFDDPNEADSISITASSDIFDLPNSEILTVAVDQGILSLPYCWDVICADVRDEPYFVNFEVITTNCLVQDTAEFSVPIYVIVQPNEQTEFQQPQLEYVWEFYSTDTFCMPVTVTDLNFFDTLQVTATSPIFNLSGNPATFDTLNGNNITEGQLCWAPTCADVRPEPYEVTFKATSNSCKTNDTELYTVNIFLTLPTEAASFFELPEPGTIIEHFIGSDSINFSVFGRDLNPDDQLTLTASSPAFESPGRPARFATYSGPEVVISNFTWNPDCPDINEDPYIVTFEINSKSCQKDVSVFLDVEILVTTPTKGEIEPIPNIFTPNGDGLNDAWTIEDKDDVCLLSFQSLVFDRWGKEVFRTNDPAFLWNGTRPDGSETSTGTYFRTIEYFYKDQRKTYSGDLQMVD